MISDSSENFGSYEDSYQKRERLQREYDSLLEGTINSIGNAKNEHIEFSKAFEEVNLLKDKIDRLYTQRIHLLSKEIRALEKGQETQELIEEGRKIQKEIDVLSKKRDEAEEKMAGFYGDSQGSLAVTDAKLKRLEELKKEIDEMDNSI